MRALHNFRAKMFPKVDWPPTSMETDELCDVPDAALRCYVIDHDRSSSRFQRLPFAIDVWARGLVTRAGGLSRASLLGQPTTAGVDFNGQRPEPLRTGPAPHQRILRRLHSGSMSLASVSRDRSAANGSALPAVAYQRPQPKFFVHVSNSTAILPPTNNILPHPNILKCRDVGLWQCGTMASNRNDASF